MGWLVGKFEIHQDLSFDRHGVAVEVVRLVLPLVHSFNRRSSQHCIATDDLEIFDVTGLADGRLQLNRTLDAHLQCLRWIPWLHALQDQPLHHALRYPQQLRSGLGGLRAGAADTRQ